MERILGWYGTGTAAKAQDLQIHEVFRKHCPNPFYLLVDVEPKVGLLVLIHLLYICVSVSVYIYIYMCVCICGNISLYLGMFIASYFSIFLSFCFWIFPCSSKARRNRIS